MIKLMMALSDLYFIKCNTVNISFCKDGYLHLVHVTQLNLNVLLEYFTCSAGPHDVSRGRVYMEHGHC